MNLTGLTESVRGEITEAKVKRVSVRDKHGHRVATIKLEDERVITLVVPSHCVSKDSVSKYLVLNLPEML